MKPLPAILERRELLRDEPEYRCTECKDSGWKLRPDGGAGSVEKCGCSLKRTRGENQQALILAGLKRGEIESAFKPWDESHQPKPVFAREWLAWVLRGAPADEAPESILRHGALPVEPWILTLFGEPGRGKTKTAAILARRFSQEGGRNLVWANATAAFDRVQKERGQEGFSAYEENMVAAGLLVIDDFGLTHRKDSETLDATVSHWLYQRHRDHLPTIIPTNATSFDQITESRISSRIAAGVYKVMRARTDYRDSGRIEVVRKGDSTWQEAR